MGGPKPTVKSFEIDKRLVYEAWRKVRANQGAPGVDAVSIEEFAVRERDNLYRLWNRKLEPIFHPDSYGYRPGRSAHDALAMTRKRCWKQDWIVDLDIRAFLDACSYCFPSDCYASNSVCGGFGGSIRSPFRRPVRT